jgi:hypothetical protein
MTTTTSAAATRHRVSEDLVKPAGSSDRNIAGMVSEMRAWCRENGITPLDFDERLREDTAAAALGIAAETLRSPDRLATVLRMSAFVSRSVIGWSISPHG